MRIVPAKSQEFGDRARSENERIIDDSRPVEVRCNRTDLLVQSGVWSDPIRVEEYRRDANRNAVLDAAPVSMKYQPYELGDTESQ